MKEKKVGDTVLLRAVSSFQKFTDDMAIDSVKSVASVKILAARNGYECGQFLIFGNENVSYDVSVSNLHSKSGGEFSASNISVFAEKYIYIDRNWHTNGLPTGNYPDALLPLDVAREYGETQIDAGKNKGVWLEFYIPEDQAPGVYIGTVTVTAGRCYSIPVELEVLNIKIPGNMHVQSLMHTNYEHMSHYEKGDMLQIYQNYLQYLLKHRICQTEFIRTADTDKYAQKVAALYDQGFNTFGIPTKEQKFDGYTSFSDEGLEKYLYSLAMKSLECGKDLVRCAVFYDWQIDEPFCVKYPPGKVQLSVFRFAEVTDKLAKKCAAMPEFDTAFGKQIVRSITGISHIITDFYESPRTRKIAKIDKDGKPYQYDMGKVTLCPPYDGYDTTTLSDPYEACQKRWWYGCNCPNAPYVSYHIDDAVYSPRLVGNMMARFGITGTLYWVNNISTEINTTGSPLFLEDPYQTAHRGFGANGDGAFLYPGAFYGLDGPVGSIRVKQIREGHQDWEILTQTQHRYAQCGKSFWPIYDRQMASLAHGTKIDSIYGDYDILHQSLMRLSEAALSSLGAYITVDTDDYGVRYTLQTQTECEVAVDGCSVTKENGVFQFYKAYEPGRWFELEIMTGEMTRVVPLYCGQGMEIILHETLFQKGSVTTAEGFVTLNPDDIRREITVSMERAGTVHVDLGTKVFCDQSLGFEIKTVEPCYITVWADGYACYKNRIKTIPRWNRIQISTKYKDFITTGINIQFESAIKAGLGAVYIQR